MRVSTPASIVPRRRDVSRASASRSDDARETADEKGPSSTLSRRDVVRASAAALTLASASPARAAATAARALQESYFAATSKAIAPERWYPYWWALPLAPYGSKTTAFAEAVPGED